MKIILDDNYSIESDISSWSLLYEKVGEISEKTGKPKTTRSYSYHATLAQALKWYLNQSLKRSDSVESVLSAITETERRIEKAVEGVKRT